MSQRKYIRKMRYTFPTLFYIIIWCKKRYTQGINLRSVLNGSIVRSFVDKCEDTKGVTSIRL